MCRITFLPFCNSLFSLPDHPFGRHFQLIHAHSFLLSHLPVTRHPLRQTYRHPETRRRSRRSANVAAASSRPRKRPCPPPYGRVSSTAPAIQDSRDIWRSSPPAQNAASKKARNRLARRSPPESGLRPLSLTKSLPETLPCPRTSPCRRAHPRSAAAGCTWQYDPTATSTPS
jgi:hypothetical protein